LVYFEAVPQNKLGESFLVDFDLVYKRFSEGEINELLEISLYDEFIAFSLDWLNIQPTDPKLQRQPDGTFEILDTAHFISAGKYQIWWKAPFIDYDGYMVASDHHWIVTDTPAVSLFTCTTFILNSRFFEFLFEGTIAKDDEFQLFTGLVDCNSGNEIGDAFMNNNPVPESYITIYSWIPETAVEMHLCWRTKTNGVYSNYERVQFSDATAYSLTLTDINATTQALPSILEFSHPYGAVIKPGEDFWFSFANLTAGHPNVVPSNNPHNSSDLGKIDISSDWGDNSNDAYFSQTFKHKKEKPNQGIVSCNKSSEQAGKCFIEGISFDNITEIFILFYSNSFSYKNGTSRFYLFGDHENVEVQYCHKLHYLIDSQIVEESDEHAFNKLSLKIDSSLLYNSNYHLSFKYLYNIFFMTFIYADIELYVDGQVCETPTASINFDSFYKRKIELFNLDLKNWTQGNLMANFIWTLSETRYPESLQIHKNDIKIATIGWGDHWLHWRQDLSNLCKICEAGYFYNSDTNEWTNIWGSNFFVSKKALAYESVDYIQKTWVYQWPLGKYPNKDGIWISCHKSWIKWTDKLPEDWTRWEFSNPFLLGKAWVEEWPDDLYDYNFESYTCDKTNYYDDVIVNSKVECQQTGSLFSRDNLSVEIKLKGVGSTIMTTAGGTLQMTVNNKRGNITVNQFIQVSPVPDPNDILTNLFPLVSSSPNVYLNETKTVDLNPDTISNYPDGTAFVVKAVVQNDWGDKAVSFINFSKDPGPTIGDAAIVCSSTPCKVLEDITITLTGDWYNSIIAEMELFIKIEIKVGSQTEVLVVPELWEETEFTFKLPVLQYEDDANLPVDILITAINNYDNSKTLTKSVAVNNTLPDDFLISDYSTITDFNDLEQLTLFASQIKFLLQPPTNGLYNGVIWRRDRDWNNQGVWVHDGAYCEWNEDYSGIDWSIKSNDLSYLAGLINTAIFNLATIFGRTRMKERSDYESKLNILSYLLVRPDLVKYESIETLPSICEKIRNLDDSPLLSFLPNFYYDYIQIVSHYYACIHYEINVKMRYYNETSFKNNINYKSYSKKLEAIKKDSKSVWLSLEKYLVKISSKVTQANPLIEYETNAGLFKTEYKVANTLNGTIYSINSALNYQIHFPSNLYAGTSLTDLTSPIRLITIDWYVSPMLNSNLDLLSSVVGTLSIHIIDKNREIVEIESKIMTITLPFDHKTGYNTSNIGCSAWSLSLTNNIMSDKLCSATVAPLSASPFINCLNWEVKYLASISTTHLSSLAIIEYTNKTIEVSNYPGIGDKKEEQFEDVPLLEQNGFYLLIALFGAYLSGMIAIKILSKLIET
jgi:hypothetical protein